MRVCLYSTDSFGLGHISRIWKIAHRLRSYDQNIECLFLSSSDSFWKLERPAMGMDYLKLIGQTSHRNSLGEKQHHPRYLNNLSSAELLQLRSQLILTAIQNYDPDMFIVDYSPSGTRGELLPALEHLKAHKPSTRIVLSYRDIIGGRDYTAKSWKEHNTIQILEDFYDVVLVFGDPQLFDFSEFYSVQSSLTSKMVYMGYLLEKIAGSYSPEACILVTAGSGIDGMKLINKTLSLMLSTRIPHRLKLVTGPDMPEGQYKNFSLKSSDTIEVFEYLYPLVSYIQQSALHISMAGYNSTCETVSTDTPTLLVPREDSQGEQTLRAKVFSEAKLTHSTSINQLTSEKIEEVLYDVNFSQERHAFRERQSVLFKIGFKELIQLIQ